jgi:hypothetical protein
MAKHTMSPQEIEAFGKKFEAWTNSLSDNERTYLKYVIESPKNLSDEALDKVSGGAYTTSSFTSLGAFTFDAYATRLDSSYLLKINTVAGW